MKKIERSGEQAFALVLARAKVVLAQRPSFYCKSLSGLFPPLSFLKLSH